MTKHKFILFYFIFLLLNQAFAQFKTQFYANGKVKSEGTFSPKDTLKQGPWRYYFNSGKLNSEGAYYNGKMHSEWKYYYESNGNIQKIENWKDGVQEGETKEFYPNGKVEKVFVYKNGIYNGLFLAYFEDGSISKKGYYSNGLPEGAWQIFATKNILKEVGYYVQGKENGWFKYYDAKGDLELEVSFIEGVRQENLLENIPTKNKKKKRKK